MTKAKVLALTGIRSEYFLQRPILRAIQAHPGLELELVATGAHLTALHGKTVDDIETDGFAIVERVESLLYSNRPGARLKGAALQMQLLAHIIEQRQPDWLLAVGDREEPLTLALCGAYMNLPTAHYAAGDVATGNVDDMVRHSISRVAHLLLAISEDSRQRLIRSGEQSWRVHNVGHSGVDRIRKTALLTPAQMATGLNVPALESEFVVVIQHPLSSEHESAAGQMQATLEAVIDCGVQAFVSYPNSDAGSHGMIEAIEQFRGNPLVHVFKNIPDALFVNLLRRASALVGNSRLGLLEGPCLQLPVINVGNRQKTRYHVENVMFVANDRREIGQAIKRVLTDEALKAGMRNCENPFGNGDTGGRVAELLASTPRDATLLRKELTF